MRYQDIQITDKSLRDGFVSKYQSGDYSGALNILKNDQVKDKVANAALLNGWINAVDDEQNQFFSNTIDYLRNLLVLFNVSINNLDAVGDYSATQSYQSGNSVIYNNEVYLYIYRTASTGVLPTDTTHWVKLGLKGTNGTPSLGLNFKFNWSSETVYAVNDAVYYKDSFYCATKNNPGTPGESGSGWSLIITLYKAALVYVEEEQYPEHPYTGEIIIDASGE